MYAQLAGMGVAAMAASQFFGFTTERAVQNGWLGPHGQCAGGGALCFYPCLSSLNWDDMTPNPRYHTIKMLIDGLGGSSVKAVLKATVTATATQTTAAAAAAAPSAAASTPPPATEAAAVVVAAFRLGPGDNRLLAVNTRNVSIAVDIPWRGSAEQLVVDRSHGHGNTPYSRAALPPSGTGVQTLLMEPFSVAILSVACTLPTLNALPLQGRANP